MIAAIRTWWRSSAPTPGSGGVMPKRPLEGLSDAEVQQRALSVAADREACVTESLFRTRDALLLSQRTTNDLTERIRSLTFWLVILTVAIVILTVVMAWPTIRSGRGWFIGRGS